jgi:hypothetical protein
MLVQSILVDFLFLISEFYPAFLFVIPQFFNGLESDF